MEHFRNEDNNIDFMVSSLGTTFDNATSISAPPPLHQSRLQNICHAQIDHYRERENEFSTLLLDFFFFKSVCSLCGALSSFTHLSKGQNANNS